MKWLSFVNGIVGIVLIVIGVSGMVTNHLVAAAIAVAGLIVLVLAAIRWITGFGRYAAGAGHPIPH